MKRIVTCPGCQSTSRLGPSGHEDGVVEIWGKAGDKIVLHCTRCGRSFLGRVRLFGAMRTWPLDSWQQAEVGIRHSSAMRARPGVEQRRGQGNIQCPDCGRYFVTQKALRAHVAAKHASP